MGIPPRLPPISHRQEPCHVPDVGGRQWVRMRFAKLLAYPAANAKKTWSHLIREGHMKKQILVVCVLLFTSCVPVYKTNYTFLPPETERGRECVNACQMTLQQCEANEQTAYQGCLSRASYEYTTCEAGKVVVPHPLLGWSAPQCVRNCNCYSSYCKPPSGELCNARYAECYRNCGGQVNSEKVCIRYCKKA